MRKIQILDFLTDLLLVSALISLFFFSFILTLRLSPTTKNQPDNVLGVSSYELQLFSDINSRYKIISSNNKEIKIDLTLDILKNKLITDYKFMVIRNKEDIEKRYAIYFDIDKDEFANTQLILKSKDDLLPIFEARTSDLNIKDQLIIIRPRSISEFELRTVSLSEDQPRDLNVEILIRSVD